MLLAATREGYANLSRLFTLANAVDRRAPKLDPALLPRHADGLVLLTSGSTGGPFLDGEQMGMQPPSACAIPWATMPVPAGRFRHWLVARPVGCPPRAQVAASAPGRW